MKNIFKKMSANLKANTRTKPLTTLAYGVVGGFLYPIIPTLIQGMGGKKADGSFNIDMSGWTGVLTGGVLTTIIGMASGKMPIAYGGIAAMTTHIVYVKGNDKVAQMIDSPIFAFDKQNTNAVQAAAGTGVSDLPPGMDYIQLPDGSMVLGQAGPMGQTVSDYAQTVSDYSQTVSDYSQTVSDYAQTVSDEDFGDAVANGDYY